MKKILVTGGNGQLGSELKLLAAAEPGWSFTFIDIDDLDISNEDSVKKYFTARSFDFLVNCAAYTAVDKAEEEQAICERVNAEAVRLLAGVCRESKIRMIHISTDYVFDGEMNQPIDETAQPRPVSVYGKTKLMGEKYVTSMLSDAYIIRTAWVYSQFGKNFAKSILNLARQREELGVVADQFGSPTYAADLAGAIVHIIRSISEGKKDEPGIYHYSNEGAITWFDFAFFIKEHFGLPCRIKPIRTSEYKTAAVRPKFSVLDKARIRNTFGLTIPHWHQSLKVCLNKLER